MRVVRAITCRLKGCAKAGQAKFYIEFCLLCLFFQIRKRREVELMLYQTRHQIRLDINGGRCIELAIK